MSHSVRGTRKRISAGLVASAVLASGLAALGASSAGAAQTVTVTRLSGANRYATAANVATNTYQPAGTVGAIGARPRANLILASGENFPDGLAAAGLAGAVDSPILLTGKDSLPVETSNAIAVLGGSVIHVMGGTGVISQVVRDQVKALGYTLNESYSGANRYDTAAKIAAAIGNGNIGGFGGKRTAILATGANYADALAAGSVAFKGKHPILLTDSAALSAETNAALTSLGIQQVIIMGGTSAVSAAVADAITAKGITVVRIAGDDRADTARDLANILITPVVSGGFGYAKTGVVLYNGYDGFADGLAAGPRAGKEGAVALPVDDASVPTPTAEYHTANKATIATITVIGGTSVISDATATAAKDAATVGSPTATITGTQGSPTVVVVFSEAIAGATFTGADIAVTLSAGDAPETGGAVTNPSGDNKTFLVTMSGNLEAGDVVSLLDNGASTTDGFVDITSAAGTLVKVASGTVPADTVDPTATLSTANGVRGVTIKFSEPVAGFTSPDIVIAAGTGGAPPALDAAPVGCGTIAMLTCFIPTTDVLAPAGLDPFLTGNTLTLATNAFQDLAGRASVATALTVAVDSVAPFVGSATGTNTNTVAAALNVGGATGVSLLAKALGSSGNAITYQVDADAAYVAISVSVTGTAIRVNIPAAGVTASAIAAAINANTSASALVTAAGGALAVNADSGPTALAGGVTTTTITITFSEAIGTIGTVNYDADGNGVAGPETAVTADTAPDADGVLTYTGSVALTAGTSKLQISGFQDLAGNSMVAVPITITAPAA